MIKFLFECLKRFEGKLRVHAARATFADPLCRHQHTQWRTALQSQILITIILCSTMSLSGCGSPRVSHLTDQLDSTTRGTAQRTKVFVQKLNEIHRQLFLDGQKIDDVPPSVDVQANRPPSLAAEDVAVLEQLLKESPGIVPSSGQSPYYSVEAVNARTSYASAIESYGTQLNLIVNSKTSAEAQKRLADLQTQLEQLGSEVTSTKLPSAQQAGAKLRELSGPVIDLGRIGANALLAYIRDKWTNETINANEQIFSHMCIALSDDIQLGAERAKTRTSRLITVYKRYVSKKKKDNTLSDADRRSYDQELDKLTRYLQEIDNENPAVTYLQAKSVHDKLAGLLKSGKR